MAYGTVNVPGVSIADMKKVEQLAGNHADRHFATGADPIRPADIGAAASGLAPNYNGLSYNADGITESGFYQCYKGTPTNDWGYVIHGDGGENCAIQFFTSAFKWGGGDIGSLAQTVWMRKKESGVWGEWEYVNPPMNFGIEYRTTQRHLNKPVYTKLINFGALPCATFKEVNIGSAENCIPLRCSGVTFAANNPSKRAVIASHLPTNITESADIDLSLSFFTSPPNTGLRIWTRHDFSDRIAHVQVWYTKPTD